MELRKLPADCRTDKSGLPRFYSGRSGEAVLVIHGYTGITDEMRYFAERLHSAGYSVSVPRLPGHGTRSEDFLTSRAGDWLRRAVDEFFDLRGRYGRVHVVGLSMGALLAILIAARFKPEKVVLAAPAVVNSDKRILLTPIMRIFRKAVPKKDYVFDGPGEYSGVAAEYWSRDWPAQAAELLSLQRKACRALPDVESDLLVVVSEKDGTVPMAAAEIIEARAGSDNIKRITLQESGHVVLNDTEKERAADEIIAWLKG